MVNDYGIILSMGRSGTLWLSELIDLENSLMCKHEMEKDDQLVHGIYSPELSRLDVRFWKEIADYYRNNKRLVDVNCRYRYHTPYFEGDSDINTAYLIRHGVKVVASYMDRDNPFAFPKWTTKAKPKNYGFDAWVDMARFNRVCHAWVDGNASLMRNSSSKLAKLEKINESYDYFCSHICSPLGIKVDKEHWEQKRKRPSHQGTREYSREFEDWPDWKQETFTNICGDLMEELGYW